MVEHAKSVKITKVGQTADAGAPDLLATQGKQSLSELGIKHGDVLFVQATGLQSASAGSSGELVGSGPKKIDANGNLVSSDRGDAQAFRPGLQSLRTQKLHWTLTDMVEFDNKYTFEVKGEQKSFCASASLDAESCNNFQLYLQQFAFQTCRCAYLYGTFTPADDIPGSVENQAKLQAELAAGAGETTAGTGSASASASASASSASASEAASAGAGAGAGAAVVKPKQYGQTKARMALSDLDWKAELKPRKGAVVQAVYEPLQEATPGGFRLLEDPREAAAEAVAKALGLVKVGFLFSHPPRDGFVMSTEEVMAAGEQALEATQGQFDSSFVVVKVTSDAGSASFDAFSLTPQCLEMVAEDALLQMREQPGHSAINETFTLIVEKKEAHVVDNDFFIKRVPILSHTSPYAGSSSLSPSGGFPRINRPDFSSAAGSRRCWRRWARRLRTPRWPGRLPTFTRCSSWASSSTAATGSQTLCASSPRTSRRPRTTPRCRSRTATA